MKKKIAITTTAVLRPKILNRTFKSFENFFKNFDCTLILNIDNVGGGDSWAVFQVANKYFSKVIPMYSVNPHFGKAFKWCWSQVTEDFDYVFNLEDDWELTDQNLNVGSLIEIMERNKNLASLKLSYKPAAGLSQKNWDRFFRYNVNGYYECLHSDKKNAGFCGHPSLLRASFVKKVTPYLTAVSNPEKQFHYVPKIVNEVLKWDWGIYITSTNMPKPLIVDIGRGWANSQGLKKDGIKAFFVKYKMEDYLKNE